MAANYERALLIHETGVACSDTELTCQVEQFYNEFAALEKRSHSIDCDDKFIAFVEQVMPAEQNIFVFKRHVLHLRNRVMNLTLKMV